MVKSLKGITRVREVILGIAAVEECIRQLDYDLITILNPDVRTDGGPLVSQADFESNLLTRVNGIRKHLKILNKKGSDRDRSKRPSISRSPATKFLDQIHRSSRPFDIDLDGEAMFIPEEAVVGFGEDDAIICRPQKHIVSGSNHFVPILDKDAGPS
jgi:hypothetical protein